MIKVSIYPDRPEPWPITLDLDTALDPIGGFNGTDEERIALIGQAIGRLGALLAERGLFTPQELLAALDPRVTFEKVVP